MKKRHQKSAVGLAIRSLREKQGLSQEELANLADLHRTYIGGIERGERNPSSQSIEKIITSLNVTWAVFGTEVDFFLGRKD